MNIDWIEVALILGSVYFCLATISVFVERIRGVFLRRKIREIILEELSKHSDNTQCSCNSAKIVEVDGGAPGVTHMTDEYDYELGERLDDE